MGKPKLMLYSQTRMPTDIVPLPEKPDKQVFSSFVEAFESDEWPLDSRLMWIAKVKDFITLNGITKRDLQAALKWLFERHYTYGGE